MILPLYVRIGCQKGKVKKMAHLTREQYRHRQQRQNKRQNVMPSSRQERKHRNSVSMITNLQADRREKTHLKLNFWEIFSDRPYVAVAIIVLVLFLVMLKLWWTLFLLLILVALGIFVIGHSHHPNRVLSLEFRMKASRKLSMLRALQLGGSSIIFLATYMRQVVSVNFSSAGSTDSLQVLEGILSARGGSYGQQGSYFLNLLNTLTSGQLFGSYRYAANSAQMMNSAAGRSIVMWIMLLMIAPAFCVLAQFFREPYARNATLIASALSLFSFLLTPHLMRQWLIAYAMENQLSANAAGQAITIGPMAYVAIACAMVVFVIAFYRFVKRDNFS